MLNRQSPDGGDLPARLERFAAIAAPESPLSARLARAAVDDPVALEILGEAPHAQPPANLLLAAIQFLLLGGTRHALGAHYPHLGFDESPGDLAADLADFCRTHRETLIEIVSTRTVQTNEVRRCTALRPAIAHATRRAPEIALIEIGPSAGLNLLLDRYGYDYGDGVTAGPEDASLVLTTKRRTPDPIRLELAPIIWRRGIDLQPLDVGDETDMRWARSLLWPEQWGRRERFDAAVAVARREPPVLVRGDAIDVIGEVIDEAPAEAALVVVHTFVLNQFSESHRSRLREALAAAGRRLDTIGIEHLTRDAPYPEILHTRYDAGDHESRHLGSAHHHGEWLAWAP